jgi:hypothetical protein
MSNRKRDCLSVHTQRVATYCYARPESPFRDGHLKVVANFRSEAMQPSVALSIPAPPVPIGAAAKVSTQDEIVMPRRVKPRGTRAGRRHRRKAGSPNATTNRARSSPDDIHMSTSPVARHVSVVAPEAAPQSVRGASASSMSNSAQGSRPDAPAASPTAEDSAKKKRHRFRKRASGASPLVYTNMTLQQKVHFEAKQAKRLARQRPAPRLPTDGKGRVRKGVDVMDYAPGAPRPSMLVCALSPLLRGGCVRACVCACVRACVCVCVCVSVSVCVRLHVFYERSCVRAYVRCYA